MKSKSKSRREFLLAAGVGSAGAVAAVAARKQPQESPGDAAAAPGRDGYHVTEHIQKYYKTTEV